MAEAHLDDQIRAWQAGTLTDAETAALEERLLVDPEARVEALHLIALQRGIAQWSQAAAARRRPRRTRQLLIAAALLLMTAAAFVVIRSSGTAEHSLVLVGGAQVAGEAPLGPGAVIATREFAGALRIGERARVDLEADSRVRIEGLAATIDLRLLSGGLVAEVEPGREPFQIQTGSGTVRVTGTAFSVRYLDEESAMSPSPFLVSVITGSVLVTGSWGEVALGAAESEVFPPATESAREEGPVQDAPISGTWTGTVAELMQDLDERDSYDPAFKPSPRLMFKPVWIHANGVSQHKLFQAVAWQHDHMLVRGIEQRSWWLAPAAGTRMLSEVMAIGTIAGWPPGEGLSEDWRAALGAWRLPDSDEAFELEREGDRLTVRAPWIGVAHVRGVLDLLRRPEEWRRLPEAQSFPAYLRFGTLPDIEKMAQRWELDYQDLPLDEVVIDIADRLGVSSVIHHSALPAESPTFSMNIGGAPWQMVFTWIRDTYEVSLIVNDGVLLVGPALPIVPEVLAYERFLAPDEHAELPAAIRWGLGNIPWGRNGNWVAVTDDRLIVSSSLPALHEQIFELLRSDHDMPHDHPVLVPPVDHRLPMLQRLPAEEGGADRAPAAEEAEPGVGEDTF